MKANKMKTITTISVDITTKKRLEKYGKYKDSYDTVLNRIMDVIEKPKDQIRQWKEQVEAPWKE